MAENIIILFQLTEIKFVKEKTKNITFSYQSLTRNYIQRQLIKTSVHMVSGMEMKLLRTESSTS